MCHNSFFVSQGTVRMLLHAKIRDAYIHPQFVTDVIKPLDIEKLYDQEVGVFFAYIDPALPYCMQFIHIIVYLCGIPLNETCIIRFVVACLLSWELCLDKL